MDVASWIFAVLLAWLGIGLAVAYVFGRIAQTMESPDQPDQLDQETPRATYFARKIKRMLQPFGH